jgi:hypothetical protein
MNRTFLNGPSRRRRWLLSWPRQCIRHILLHEHDIASQFMLVAIQGVCFNSLYYIQAMASLTYFQPQIEAMHAKAEQFDVPTPVIDAVYDLMHGIPASTLSLSCLIHITLSGLRF